MSEATVTTADRLNRDLDTCIWDTLRALADDAEERGDGVLAAGYRWLAERESIPTTGAYGLWVWGGWVERHPSGQPLRLQRSALPEKSTYERMKSLAPKVIGRPEGAFDSLSAAFRCAARAIGEWLAAQGASGNTSTRKDTHHEQGQVAR